MAIGVPEMQVSAPFFLDTFYSDVCFGVIISLNAVFIGVQADFTGTQPSSFLGMLSS